jgi:hypothetical protein
MKVVDQMIRADGGVWEFGILMGAFQTFILNEYFDRKILFESNLFFLLANTASAVFYESLVQPTLCQWRRWIGVLRA